jgi:hypothetical protein
VSNHSATNKIDRENTTTTNTLTTVSAQNKAVAKKNFLMCISWQRKYKKKIKIFLNLSFLCLFVSVFLEEHTECPLLLRMTRDEISTVIPSMVK